MCIVNRQSKNSLNIDYTSIILKLRHIVVILLLYSCHAFVCRGRTQGHCLLALCSSSLRMSPSMSNGKELFSLEICYERNTTFWFRRTSQVLLELWILRLKQHSNLIALLFLQISSFFRAIWGRMTVLSANCALNRHMRFCLERTSPGSMAFLLAVLTIVIINSLYLKVIAVEQVF